MAMPNTGSFIDWMYLDAESQLSKLKADGVEVQIGRELIDLKAPEFLEDRQVASLRYDGGTIYLLVADESDPTNSVGTSVDELPMELRLAIVASTSKLVACGAKKASESGDVSEEDYAKIQDFDELCTLLYDCQFSKRAPRSSDDRNQANREGVLKAGAVS